MLQRRQKQAQGDWLFINDEKKYYIVYYIATTEIASDGTPVGGAFCTEEKGETKLPE